MAFISMRKWQTDPFKVCSETLHETVQHYTETSWLLCEVVTSSWEVAISNWWAVTSKNDSPFCSTTGIVAHIAIFQQDLLALV